MLLKSNVEGTSQIPSKFASVHVCEKPVPAGLAQKLPPRNGPPMMFMPRCLDAFQKFGSGSADKGKDAFTILLKKKLFKP